VTDVFKAIPTTYRGHRFRSRLEARWAAFFDRARWPWAYEPVDLAGWIPDFVLLKDPAFAHVTADQPIFVEVKPALGYAELAPHRRRIERSGTTGHVVIVGAVTPFAGPALGSIRFAGLRSWGPATLAWCKSACAGRLTIERQVNQAGDHACLLCGALLRDRDRNVVETTSRAARIWAEAGNDTRWKGD